MDHSLFTLDSSNLAVFILVYVYDIIITGSNEKGIFAVIEKLKTNFSMKDLGPLNYFLGIEASRNSNGLHLRQSKYISDLLDRAKMVGAKPLSSPTTSGSKLSVHDGDLLHDPTEYRQVVGSLQYCTLTRPDIAYIVNQLCLLCITHDQLIGQP